MTYTAIRREQSYPATLYTVFDLPPAATAEELHERYRLLCREWHPDLPGGGDVERYKLLTESYQTLKNPELRQQYNLSLERSGTACDNCNGAGVRYSDIASFRPADIACATRRICPNCEGTGQKALPSFRHLGSLAGRAS